MGSHQKCNEAQLIHIIQVGSPEEVERAFYELYDANDLKLRNHLMYKGLQEFEIDDVCAVVWERALDRIGSYVHTGIPYLSWLKRTANYVTKEMYRRKQEHQCKTQQLKDDFDVAAQDVWTHPLLNLLEQEDEVVAAQWRERVKDVLGQLIEQLPSDYKDVLVALHEMGLSREETAELLGWSRRKVYDTYYRARKRLEELLLDHGITSSFQSECQ